MRVSAGLAEGLGLRGTARVFEVAPPTVLQWLVEAAAQRQAFSAYVLHDLHIRQGQLDALSAVLRAVKDGEGSPDGASDRLSQSPHWVWTAMAPESKVLLALDVGERPLARAQRVVHPLAQLLAPAWPPLFGTDGCRASLPAWLPP